jgi:hypothetical protein
VPVGEHVVPLRGHDDHGDPGRVGSFFASFVVPAGSAPLPEVDAEVGIDLGLTHFAVRCPARSVEGISVL